MPWHPAMQIASTSSFAATDDSFPRLEDLAPSVFTPPLVPVESSLVPENRFLLFPWQYIASASSLLLCSSADPFHYLISQFSSL
jgi:hypothetical protein